MTHPGYAGDRGLPACTGYTTGETLIAAGATSPASHLRLRRRCVASTSTAPPPVSATPYSARAAASDT
jgi:hypothetical protein